MKRVILAVVVAHVCVASVSPAESQGRMGAVSSPGLQILVVAGEDAVNVIQQRTAVAPVIEVRDRNGQPVSGATITFSIRGGRAATFASGRSALTVTTDAAGHATASGLTPVASGTVRIDVQVSSRGQTVGATVTQTNVATAAQVSSVAVATAGAASGGLSPLAIGGLVAGGAGGAALAVVAGRTGGSSSASGGGGSSGSGSNSGGGSSPGGAGAPPGGGTTPLPTTYSGPFSTQLIVTTTTTSGGGSTSCDSTRNITGVLTMTLTRLSDGSITGSASTTGTQVEVAVTVSPFCQLSFGSTGFSVASPVSGTEGDFGFTTQTVVSGTGGQTQGTITNTTTFAGSLVAGTINGTMTHSQTAAAVQLPPNNGVITGSGTTTFPVTLR